MEKVERNINLDYFKLFLAILVITIHIPTEDTPYKALYLIFHEGFSRGLARIAVPCFFIINGYFLNINNSKKTRKYIFHVIILYTTWSLFYLPWFPDEMSFKRTFTVLFFGFHHLWYLAALLESVIIFYFINKVIKNKKILLTLSILLFVAGYLIHVLLYAPPTSMELNKFRNFLFVGLPFFMLGNILRSTNIEKYKKEINIALLVSFILFIIEVYVSKSLNISEVFLSLFLLCPLSIMAVSNYPKYGNDATSIGLLSSAVYFIHPFIISISRGLFGYHLYIFPIVTILSILLSFLIIYSNKTIKIFL